MLTAFFQQTSAQGKLIDSLRSTLRYRLTDTTRANTYYDIANEFYKQGNSDSALYYLKLTRQLCIRKKYDAGLGDFNRLRGAICMHQGSFEEALIFFQASITNYTKANKPKVIAQVYHNMGWLYKMMGENQHVLAYARQGLLYIQRAIEIKQRFNSVKLLPDTYINLGIIYEDLGDFKQGRDCFFRALAINEQLKAKPEANRVIYNNLGKNYNVEHQYEQAIDYLNKSLSLNLALKRSSSLAHNYRNLATSYLGLHQPDKALYFARKALEQVKISKDIPLTNSVYWVLSKTYAASGQYDLAYAFVLEHKRIDDSLMNLEKTRTIAQLQGRYEVQQAHTLATTVANFELAKTREIAKIEAEKAKQIAAIQAKESHQIALLRIKSELEKTRAIAEVQTKHDTYKREQQFALLDHQNHIRTRQFQYMAGGLFLLILLLSILVGQYLTIRRANRSLSEQNDIITIRSRQVANQADQLRTLIKELHHRVKNNLAIVSSLLNLQIIGLHDEKAIAAVRVGQQRVEAMSLIHQQLYLTDQVTVINMQEYLTQLAESMMRAYGYQEDKFRLQLNIEQHELDVDIAIPLGLIVNELITNAFKYAYVHQQYPSLRIGLHSNSDAPFSSITLEVQDNGPGIGLADWQKAGKQTSFGKRLITSLSEQLEGNFELLKENGTLFRLHIPSGQIVL
ncbi:MAG: signal transduction histidine kinase [Spirosoma sp.]|nr:signal transduction histidine kinase [Spirosoma sp.]